MVKYVDATHSKKRISSAIATGRNAWSNFFIKKPNVLMLETGCCLLLSNLIQNRPGLRGSSESLYAIFRSLKLNGGAEDFEAWLRSGWLNVARVADMLYAELRNERVTSHGIPV